MRYGIAIWNYQEEGVPLLRLADEFAGFGFDAISFLPGQILDCEDAEAQELVALLREQDLAATVHGSFEMRQRDVETLLERLGESLRVLSFDAAMTADSCGHFYDAARMAALLRHVEGATRHTAVHFAVEDFPLDALALDRFRADLGPLPGCPRYGALIDLGHLNMRIHLTDYFGSLAPADYIRRVPLPIVEIHVHDNLGEKDTHAPIGFGNVDFEAVARGLREVGFDGVSTIEIAPSFHGSTPAASKPRARESLEKWREIWESASRTCSS
jgi:sugar phosphate isomerase/epimerase